MKTYARKMFELEQKNVCLFQGFITPNNENKEETVVLQKDGRYTNRQFNHVIETFYLEGKMKLKFRNYRANLKHPYGFESI